MRKQILLLGVFASMFFVSCSEEEITTSDVASTDLEVTIEHVNFDPATAQPTARFNEEDEGLYHGVIVSLDTEIHGKIWINVNNDGNYNATVVTNTGDRFAFIGKQLNREGNLLSYIGDRGSFSFDVADYNNPVITNVIIDNKDAHISAVKDRAGQRAAAILGTYQDFDDPDFNGTWDIITDGTPNEDAFGFPLVSEVVFTHNNGMVFTDTEFENFEYPCFFYGLDDDGVLITEIAPVFLHEDPMTTPNGRNEFWLQNQVFDLGGQPLTYWIGQSSALIDVNGLEFVNHGFFNNDFADTPNEICTAFDGQKGLWFWNGRAGFSSFDDPFDVPMMAPENVDYEGFRQMVSEATFQMGDSSVLRK